MIQQKWWQSKVTWLALIAVFMFVMKEWIGIEIPKFDVFVDLMLAALGVLGVINNGYNPIGWGANEPKKVVE